MQSLVALLRPGDALPTSYWNETNMNFTLFFVFLLIIVRYYPKNYVLIVNKISTDSAFSKQEHVFCYNIYIINMAADLERPEDQDLLSQNIFQNVF